MRVRGRVGSQESIGDKLPECLIHKIFSYLSHKEAAKSSLVCQTWLQAWFTYPNLEFKVEYGKGNNNRLLVDKVMERYRERKIPLEKFALSVSSTKYHQPLAFPRIEKWLDIALKNGVKDLICEVIYGPSYPLPISSPSYPFPISKFLASKSLRELVLRGCDLMNLLLFTSTSQLANCHSLRKLSLHDVCLDDNLLQTVFNCCPLIVNLRIASCCLLTKIELRNLQNIKSVDISTSFNAHNSSVKIQSSTLEHLTYSGSHALLDILECQNLKSLELSRMEVSEGFLRNLISTSQVLERLKLDSVSGELNERLNICGSQSLKVLGIQNCEDLGEIDASNLVSLQYVGTTEVKIAKESGQLKNSLAHLICHKDDLINAAWFWKLRKFLSNLTSWSHVSLYFDECNEINMAVFQLRHSVAIRQVVVLDVYMGSSEDDVRPCRSFVDALLGSCHPRRLNVFSTIEMITCFKDRLIYMKNSSHSTSHESKPCHSQLKEVKAYKVLSEHEHVELDSGELATLTVMDTIYFLLDW